MRDVVEGFVGPQQAIKSMEEFEALRFMRAENLATEQVDALVSIRNAIPNPGLGTPMQKVIKGSSIDDFIGQNRNINGFVAKQGDAGTDVFQGSDDLIEALRLDYDGGFQGESSVGVIEWDFDPSTMDADIPFGPGFSTNPVVDDPYPFVGNGFTATTSGRLVPEYRMTDPVIPPTGAKLFEVDQAGNKTLRAEYINGQWVGS